jgi:cell wall-associated NlpC family hydrolase
MGEPYRWGADGAAVFDCTELVRWAYHELMEEQ